MMVFVNNMFLRDPNEIRLPPEEVRLTKVQVMPQPTGRQVKIHLELTPFMKRPNIEVTITSHTGIEVGHTTILETMLHILEFTVHLHPIEASDEYKMEISVYYQNLPSPSDTPVEMPLPEPMVVDHNTTQFSAPNTDH